MKEQRPNILIIQTDQQRWDVSEPDHPCKTPNLDRMVREGLRFSNVFPPMAHCCPSRASFMTGLYPSQHGVWNNTHNSSRFSSGLNKGVETWSEKLKQAGYRLAFSGKWHVSADENPRDRGWDEGTVDAGAIEGDDFPWDRNYEDWARHEPRDTPEHARRKGQICKPGWGDWQMFGTREEHEPEYSPNPDSPWRDGRGDCRHLDAALSQLEESMAGDRPWCQYVGFNGPHDPYIVPQRYRELYDPDKLELPASWNDALEGKPEYCKRLKRRFDQLSEYEKRECLAHYYGYCSMIDDMLGELLAKLEAASQLDRTIVIFCSDHGDFMGEHGLTCKGIPPYDGGYKVPLLIRAPSLIQSPGRRVDSLVSLMDICPTLVELSGSELPNAKSIRSHSLLPFFARSVPPENWRKALYLQCNGTEVFYMSRSVRSSKWKLVYNPVAYDELYDLENDPDERINLAERSEYADTKKDLYRQLWMLASESEDTQIASEYHTVSLADHGPKLALKRRARKSQ